MKAFALSILLLPLTARAKPLQSPWDSTPVTLTNAPYACPAVHNLSPDLTTSGFYSDGKRSIIDPAKWKAYVSSTGPYKQLGQQIVNAADAYRTTGSRAADYGGQRRRLHREDVFPPGVLRAGMGNRRDRDRLSKDSE